MKYDQTLVSVFSICYQCCIDHKLSENVRSDLYVGIIRVFMPGLTNENYDKISDELIAICKL